VRIKVGGIILFAGREWIILDAQNNKLLILSEKFISDSEYYFVSGYTWELCELRSYLNDTFFNSLRQDKARIAETNVTTHNNPWWPEALGGNVTNDKIFLLSIEEVVRYFGDSGQLMKKNPTSEGWIDDRYNSSRIAKGENGIPLLWWLRSPGDITGSSAFITDDGRIGLFGLDKHNDWDVFSGVRPALWLNL